VHHPPCKDICYFLLGCDDAGRIGAAVHFSPIDGLSLVRIDFLAVECRFRGQGGAWAAEALDYVLDEITLMAVGAGVATTLVVAEIHAENTASQRLFGSNGFTLQGPGPQDYELWAIEFVHPTVDDV
jgi:RimJ/RimL family protein N-acetyltransferase